MEIRPARPEDARSLFDWRNDPLTLAMSNNIEPTGWADHVDWLGRRLARPDPKLFISEVDGVAVGTFRVDGSEISYTIAPEFRRLGYAVQMLRLAYDMFGALDAHIKPGNAASIAAATKAGHRVVVIHCPSANPSEDAMKVELVDQHGKPITLELNPRPVPKPEPGKKV